MSDINQLTNPIITGVPDFQPGKGNVKATGVTPGKSFGEMLERTILQTRQLTFSRHAQNRTEQRGITLTESDLERLNQAVGMAGDKGLGDALVFMNNTAFIVNVPSKVVVTVVDNKESERAVFTNIDGAVII